MKEGDGIEIAFGQSTVRNNLTGEVLQGTRFPEMLLEVMEAGGIYPMMEAKGLLEDPNPETA